MKISTNKWLIAVILATLAFALRFHQFELHSPFDWDQDRDYSQVKRIERGEIVTLGPIAKGVGGFYLGSLYYYLLYPGYYLMDGSLSALPLTSIVLDSLVAGLLYLLLSRFAGRRVALSVALIWVFSTFFIGASRVSWNVALVPIWSLFTLYSFYNLIQTRAKKYLYYLALLLGLSAHIHVAAIPVIPLLSLLFIRQIKFSFLTWVKAFWIGLIPVLPLILFDFKHGGVNLRLLVFQSRSHLAAVTPIYDMFVMMMIKLGKVVSGIFLNRFADQLYLGILVLILSLRAYWRDKRLYMQVAGASVIVSSVLVLALRDYGFPEYYFAPAYLGVVLLLLRVSLDLFSYLGRWQLVVLSLVLLQMISLNFKSFLSFIPGVYSLGVKQAVVVSLHDLGSPLDISYDFDPGRDGGMRYLVELEGISLDSGAEKKVILTDKINYPAYIDGELASDQFVMGRIKSAMYIVQ